MAEAGLPSHLVGASDQRKEAFRRTNHVHFVAGPVTLDFNPVIYLLSTVVIWSFVIACAATPDVMLAAMNEVAFTWIPDVWTWLYIVSQDIWVLVLFYLMLSPKYGKLKLGKDDEPPQFSDLTWFSMLFSAGIATGFFYYACAEPVWHMSGSRWTSDKRGYGNENEDAAHAMVVTYYHWGFHGWIPYVVMGSLIAIMTYRRDFPMTIRYTLWPLIGEYCYGPIGDFMDFLSIVTTIFGVCTSLGLGIMQINAGLQRINYGMYRGVPTSLPSGKSLAEAQCAGTGNSCGDGQESWGIQRNAEIQVMLIMAVTFMATMSVVVGLDYGIANLARFTFAMGVWLVVVIMCLGEPWYTLDLTVQSIGYYFWYLVKIGFWTDAFERLGEKGVGIGGAPDGLGGSASWMGGWTVFYWGWWISWGPFVGTFLARISKGRTLRSFIAGTLVIPCLWTFLWFGVLGGEAMRMQRMAKGVGLCDKDATKSYSNLWNETEALLPNHRLKPTHSLVEELGGYQNYKWTRKVRVGSECVESLSYAKIECKAGGDESFKLAGTDPCNNAAGKIDHAEHTIEGFLAENAMGPRCDVAAPKNLVCMSASKTEDMLFDLFSSYGDSKEFADFLCTVGLICMVFYFVTSSDSGSFVVDIISCNGVLDPPLLQRIFWSITEGATACALLWSGKNAPSADGALKALQAASMITGLPYTFVMCWCCQSLLIVVAEETGDLALDRKAFNKFIFAPGPKGLGDFLRQLGVSLIFPIVPLKTIFATMGKGWPMGENKIGSMIWAGFLQILYLLGIIFWFASIGSGALGSLGFAFWSGFGVFVGVLRVSARNLYQIKHGDIITDLICGLFVPWFVLVQITDHIDNPGKIEMAEPLAVKEAAPEASVVGAPAAQSQEVDA